MTIALLGFEEYKSDNYPSVILVYLTAHHIIRTDDISGNAIIISGNENETITNEDVNVFQQMIMEVSLDDENMYYVLKHLIRG